MKKYIILIIYLCCGTLFAADSIGSITGMEGNVLAKGSDGNARELQVKSPIYEGDQVIVDSGAKAQLKLIDGSMLILVEDTEYHFDQFRYGKMMESNISSSTLAKGGLRLLAGKIANGNPDKYTVKTPAATIGIRGTAVDAAYENEELSCGVIEGSATVKNTKGAVTLEKEEYATARADTVPQRVSTIPRTLMQKNFNTIRAAQGIRQAPKTMPHH